MNLQASGLWSPQESKLHINLLEFQVVKLGLQAFQEFCQGKNVLIMSDNATVVSHIKNQGGTRFWELCQRTIDLLKWSVENRISLQSRYIPGQRNVLADQLSRKNQILPAEWSLHPQICARIWKVWGAPHVDLFATQLNHKLPVYCSPFPDPAAWSTDALVTPWDDLWTYAFPLPALVRKVIAKLTQSKSCHMILVAPLWTQQPWFAEMLFLLTDYPRALPLWKSLLKQPHLDRFHPTPEVFHYHAWMLSSVASETEVFQKKLPPGSPEPTDPLHQTHTKQNGPNSAIGAIRGRLMHSQPVLRYPSSSKTLTRNSLEEKYILPNGT